MQFFNIGVDLSRPFALIEKNGIVCLFQGRVEEIRKLIDIHTLSKKENRDIIFVLPYHTIREKGGESHGDEPILALVADKMITMSLDQFSILLPDENIEVNGEITPSMTDDDFSAMVEKFKTEAIETGLCSQTTLSRKFSGTIKGFSIEKILSLYKHLLRQPGHYMTVLFANIDQNDFTQSQFILAGTPERHLEIRGNETIMCPIAGTCRKEDHQTFPKRLKTFLQDPKEINELFQVLDEEMKMMGAICPKGGTIHGPYLRDVGAVVHTEYTLIGRRSTHAIDALRGTLHAPTVVGSPLISAARLITRFEPESRRYYAGEIGIYRQPRMDVPDGDLDCAILIRGAEISGEGRFHIQAGAGIVRDSDPASEAKETKAKALGLLNVITGKVDHQKFLSEDLQQEIELLLQSRNSALSPFWQADQADGEDNDQRIPGIRDKTVTIINNEDDFAYMIGHMLQSFGLMSISIIDTFEFDVKKDSSDLIIIGPGPGDPADMNHPRMARLQDIIRSLMETKKSLFGICLGHQALAIANGISVIRQSSSTQGMPRQVKVAGKSVTLGFYNSFSPLGDEAAAGKQGISFSYDDNDRIIAMEADGMMGYQFHPESVMSIDGHGLMKSAVTRLLQTG